MCDIVFLLHTTLSGVITALTKKFSCILTFFYHHHRSISKMYSDDVRNNPKRRTGRRTKNRTEKRRSTRNRERANVATVYSDYTYRQPRETPETILSELHTTQYEVMFMFHKESMVRMVNVGGENTSFLTSLSRLFGDEVQHVEVYFPHLNHTLRATESRGIHLVANKRFTRSGWFQMSLPVSKREYDKAYATALKIVKDGYTYQTTQSIILSKLFSYWTHEDHVKNKSHTCSTLARHIILQIVSTDSDLFRKLCSLNMPYPYQIYDIIRPYCRISEEKPIEILQKSELKAQDML